MEDLMEYAIVGADYVLATGEFENDAAALAWFAEYKAFYTTLGIPVPTDLRLA